MRSIRSLSTGLTALSTPLKDKKKVLTSTFTTYPQDSATPITTIFIYKYLSPQANLWVTCTKGPIPLILTYMPNFPTLRAFTA